MKFQAGNYIVLKDPKNNPNGYSKSMFIKDVLPVIGSYVVEIKSDGWTYDGIYHYTGIDKHFTKSLKDALIHL